MGIDFFRVAPPPPMFLKYNLRAVDYSVESLQPMLILETFRYPNSQKRDLRDSDEGEDEKSHN